MDDVTKKHVKDIEWIRELLSGMDDIAHPIMGIRDWDDAACIKFSGKLLASTDGPYCKRLVMKSALIHASTDVVVKGGRPLFALDNVIGPMADVRQMMESLKAQALAMGIPILGGNTFIDDESEPLAAITVIGELLIDEPIRDSTSKEGDVIALLGPPLWGEQEERVKMAKNMFETWHEAIKKVKIHAAKDVTKGGLVSVVYEMERKCGHRFALEDLKLHMTRNLDNFIATLSEYEYVSLEGVCARHKCPLTRIGRVC